jgi:hypothetical protein
MESHKIINADCLTWIKNQPSYSVDLVFGSPPYEDCRTYGIDFRLQGQDWVDWMVEVVRESLRVCRGWVAFVVEGKTRKFRWSATPALLMADLHRAGIHLRKPPIYKRVGIPGSGGPDWWRNDFEFVVCATHGGKLPWSDNTAMGHEPKFQPGGAMSYRNADGLRKNNSSPKFRLEDGRLPRKAMRRKPDGTRDNRIYKPPKLANPGNVIQCHGGGGHFGSPLAHENEAPFPENLAEFFIRSFCPPGGIVLDPFCGSGTTAAVAKKHGRQSISIDIRETQTDLTKKRLAESRT